MEVPSSLLGNPESSAVSLRATIPKSSRWRWRSRTFVWPSRPRDQTGSGCWQRWPRSGATSWTKAWGHDDVTVVTRALAD